MKRTRQVDSPTTAAAMAPIAVAPFGPPALLNGEDEKAYSELLLQLSSAVQPVDTIEEIWVGEIVALTWEVLRWRRLKAALLDAQAPDGLKQILGRLMDEQDDADWLAERWARGHASAVKKVDSLLAKAGLTIDAVQAETLVLQFDAVERIDRLEATAEHRRNAILREIERHRAGFASSLRRAAAKVEDAAFEDVTPAKP